VAREFERLERAAEAIARAGARSVPAQAGSGEIGSAQPTAPANVAVRESQASRSNVQGAGYCSAPMSERNVEIVRRLYESVNRRHWDRLAELLDPDVAQHGTVGGLGEGNVVRGVSEIRQMYEKGGEVWDEQRIEPEKLIDAGDRVVVFQLEYQRGKSSGVELVVETAAVLDLRDGRVVRIQGYMDRATALQAAGLSKGEAYSSS
jgi:ketosteroid isomerase-like protein